MKNTVLMLVHKDLDRVKKSADWFLKHDVSLVIHVDNKRSEIKKSLSDYFKNSSSVHVIEDPVSVNWSGLSIVEAEVKMVKKAAEHFPDSDYYHLISGECQPLFKPDEWSRFLNGKSYLECENLPEYEWRIRRFMPFGESPKNRTLLYRLVSKALKEIQSFFPLRKNFGSEAQLKGSQWFSLCHHDFMMIHKHLDKDFLKRFTMTRCADEHFVQILFAQLKIDYNPYNLMYTIWASGKASPEYLTLDQLSEARQSGRYLFARKVDDIIFNEFSRERLQ